MVLNWGAHPSYAHAALVDSVLGIQKAKGCHDNSIHFSAAALALAAAAAAGFFFLFFFLLLLLVSGCASNYAAVMGESSL